MPANVFNDGGRPINSSLVKLFSWDGAAYTTGVTYATDDFSFESDTSDVVFTDQKNMPVGQEFVMGRTSGSATLQFAASTTAVPIRLSVFRWLNPDAATYRYFVVTKVGRTEKKGDESKSPISFAEVLSPLSVFVDAVGPVNLTSVSW